MRQRIILFLCLLAVLLNGCYRTTTVILPPDTEGSTSQTQPSEVTGESETFTTASTQETVTQPATEPEPTPDTRPETTPVTEPATEPPAEPTTVPTTKPTTEPSAPPATERPTEPTTQPAKPDVYDISGHSIDTFSRSVRTELNVRRESEGLSPLTMDDTLCALAAIRAYECGQNTSHTRPDGRAWFTVMEDYDYSLWSNRGENLLYASQGYTASQLVDTWMRSATHRDLILSPDFSVVGVGFYKSNGLIYIAAIFAG